MGRYTETHNEKTSAGSHTLHDQRTQLTGKSQNSFLLWRLQIEMLRQVEKPTPALIETTAHAKRCSFGLSRKKSWPALISAGRNCAKSAVSS
jgi:hypothetical protein